MPVVVDPQVGGEPEREWRKGEAARQREEVVEDGNTGCEEEGHDRHTERARQPDEPVYKRVGLEVLGVAQDADEDVLGRHVDEDARADEQAHQTDTIRHLLHHLARAAKRRGSNPLAAVAVHDEAERQVRRRDDAHADVHGLVVVARLAHLGDDGEKGRGSGAGAEDGGGGRDALDEGRVADDVVAQVEVAFLGRRGRAIDLCDANAVEEKYVSF